METARIDKTREWTVEDYLHLGEMSTPCQLINGELIMSPAPAILHQSISKKIFKLLDKEAEKGGGDVFYAPIDLFIDKKNVYQPDLVYISKENRHIISKRGIEGVPDLVVEILSPSNAFTDRYFKKKIYQNIGVKEYSIVDPGNHTIEIYTHNQTDHDIPHLYRVDEGKITSTVLPDLAFDLKVIFE
jgi:Uma2 family endonuclease